ncbi:hypothetical protein [Xanthovirga aplysinae]|uniref:hypothetical protein n=1 Tax=Xanthovirga aplysinae TaxID=2529853 RepID=UPI001FE8AE67|nr:hypothetical protein [Xanthovirga aplysinae]
MRIIDLTTIEGMKKADLKIYPGDIIYVEPVRRVFSESIRDVTPILGILSSITTLILVIPNIFPKNESNSN